MAVIKDVARLAGVSTGTVSKYFSDPSTLKEENRQKVEAAVRELRYAPSNLAEASGSSGRT